MAALPLKVTVAGARELRDAARDLRRAKGTLRQETAAALKASGKDTLRRVKTNVETMTMTGYPKPGASKPFRGPGGRGGIRKRISRVTELDVSTSAAAPRIVFLVRNERLGNASNMPRLLDSGKRFRHPIMGNRRAWAAQKGEPWFRVTILKALPKIRADVDKALDRVRQSVERG